MVKHRRTRAAEIVCNLTLSRPFTPGNSGRLLQRHVERKQRPSSLIGNPSLALFRLQQPLPLTPFRKTLIDAICAILGSRVGLGCQHVHHQSSSQQHMAVPDMMSHRAFSAWRWILQPSIHRSPFPWNLLTGIGTA